MSQRIRKKIIGGKAPWEYEKRYGFDEMDYDCIAFGVMVLATRHQLCGKEQTRVVMPLSL